MPMSPRLLRPLATGGLDADARTYIAAVEAADTEPLEQAVKIAINDFVVGCKADGIWDAIKASCILAGARTLAGALTPLKGAAPTNNNFVSGDYNRETGLVGDGETKYLNTNRNNNADPQDNFHADVYVHTLVPGVKMFFGGGNNAPGSTNAYPFLYGGVRVRCRTDSGTTTVNYPVPAAGLIGVSRSSSASFVGRSSGASQTVTLASQTPTNADIFIYASNNSGAFSYNPSRLSFYSVGESLDLSLLDSRVVTLLTALGVAIP